MKKILIVDDDKKIQEIYTKLLKAEGFEIVKALNADDANEILKRDADIELVLLDIKMPEVDGSDIYDIIQLFHKKIKVIVSSVYPLYEQKRIIVGADDYYDKSQGMDVLLMKIKEVLENEQLKEDAYHRW